MSDPQPPPPPPQAPQAAPQAQDVRTNITYEALEHRLDLLQAEARLREDSLLEGLVGVIRDLSLPPAPPEPGAQPPGPEPAPVPPEG